MRGLALIRTVPRKSFWDQLPAIVYFEHLIGECSNAPDANSSHLTKIRVFAGRTEGKCDVLPASGATQPTS